MINMSGKKVLITGASPDFGLILSLLMARHGAELFLAAISQKEIQLTCEIVREEVPESIIHPFVVDIGDARQVKGFGSALSEITNVIDILVNNASHWLAGSTREKQDDEILKVIDSNIRGSILICNATIPLIRNSKAGCIVNLLAKCSSINDRHAESSEVFSAGKSGHSAFMKRLRDRTKGTGIRIVSIYPPNFHNTSPQRPNEWGDRRDILDTSLPVDRKDQLPTARNVFNSIMFSLSQDEVCSIDEIEMSNTRTDFL